MRRFVMLALLLSLILPAPACALFLKDKPKVYTQTIDPQLDLSALRQRIPADLNIVVDPALKDPLHRSRSNDLVVIEVTNFRESIAGTIKKALDPQFKSVVVAAEETGTGLELVVIEAKYTNETDVMDYHYALMHNGIVAYECKGSTVPITRIMQATRATWQDKTAKATFEYVESNLALIAEDVRDQLLMNDKMTPFWSEFIKNAKAEAKPADTEVTL